MSTFDQEPITADAYSSSVNDQERQALLAPDIPRPLIVASISQTLNQIANEELKGKVAERTFRRAVNSGKVVPPVVKEFVDSLTSENNKLAPYTGGSEKEYLAIFCGAKDAIKIYKEEQPELAQQFAQTLAFNTREALQQNPAYANGNKALEVILGNNN